MFAIIYIYIYFYRGGCVRYQIRFNHVCACGEKAENSYHRSHVYIFCVCVCGCGAFICTMAPLDSVCIVNVCMCEHTLNSCAGAGVTPSVMRKLRVRVCHMPAMRACVRAF